MSGISGVVSGVGSKIFILNIGSNGGVSKGDDGLIFSGFVGSFIGNKFGNVLSIGGFILVGVGVSGLGLGGSGLIIVGIGLIIGSVFIFGDSGSSGSFLLSGFGFSGLSGFGFGGFGDGLGGFGFGGFGGVSFSVGLSGSGFGGFGFGGFGGSLSGIFGGFGLGSFGGSFSSIGGFGLGGFGGSLSGGGFGSFGLGSGSFIVFGGGGDSFGGVFGLNIGGFESGSGFFYMDGLMSKGVYDIYVGGGFLWVIYWSDILGFYYIIMIFKLMKCYICVILVLLNDWG